jgi:hypothetical protein
LASFLKRKKKNGRGTKIFVALIVLGILAVIASAVMQSSPSTSFTTTSQTSSITSSALLAGDFSIVPTIFLCGYHTNDLKFATLSAQLRNDKNMAFHYLSAKITFANYTLANGTVVQVNQQWVDNSPTFDTTHTFSLPADFAVPRSGPKIVSIEFIVTANVQEVSQPITRTVTAPPNC